MKRTVIFTDIALVPTFVLTFYSGIKLHVAGHGTSHEVWHNFALFHIITSLLFLAACIMHIRSHAAWYKGLFQKDLEKHINTIEELGYLRLVSGKELERTYQIHRIIKEKISLNELHVNGNLNLTPLGPNSAI